MKNQVMKLDIVNHEESSHEVGTYYIMKNQVMKLVHKVKNAESSHVKDGSRSKSVNSNESSDEVGTVNHGKLSHVVTTENQRESRHEVGTINHGE